MKTFFRILKWLGITIVLVLLIIIVASNIMYDKKFDAPYPEIHASKDSLIIEHGKHLIFSTAHCVECHFRHDDSIKVAMGEDIDVAGGFRFEFPGGAFYSKNISSDKETGIGNMSDAEIARVLRYGVKPDGTVLIPVMEFQNLSDADITAIISYLRTTEPVSLKVPKNEYNLLGKAILSFLIKPVKPIKTPPVNVVPDTSAEYGEYIASSVSNCKGCHTQRDMNTGDYIGEWMAGGRVETIKGDPEMGLFAPNLTPDPETGHIYNWTFDQFRNRFSQGKLISQSIMPWGQFKHLNETELKAIWKYLHTLTPVKKKIGPALQVTEK